MPLEENVNESQSGRLEFLDLGSIGRPAMVMRQRMTAEVELRLVGCLLLAGLWNGCGGGSEPTPGITVAPTTGLMTTEKGGQATFAIRLETRPSADVTIGLMSSDTSEGTVSPMRL